MPFTTQKEKAPFRKLTIQQLKKKLIFQNNFSVEYLQKLKHIFKNVSVLDYGISKLLFVSAINDKEKYSQLENCTFDEINDFISPVRNLKHNIENYYFLRKSYDELKKMIADALENIEILLDMFPEHKIPKDYEIALEKERQIILENIPFEIWKSKKIYYKNESSGDSKDSEAITRVIREIFKNNFDVLSLEDLKAWDFKNFIYELSAKESISISVGASIWNFYIEASIKLLNGKEFKQKSSYDTEVSALAGR